MNRKYDVHFFDLGFHEGQEIDLFLRQVKGHRRVSRIHIWGVDATPELYERAKRRYRSGGEVEFHFFNFAVGSSEGETELYLHEAGHLGNSIYADKRGVTADTIKVQLRKFSQWFTSLPVRPGGSSICILKANIEGAEWDLVNDLEESGLFSSFDIYAGGHFSDIAKVQSLVSIGASEKAADILKKRNIKIHKYCVRKRKFPDACMSGLIDDVISEREGVPAASKEAKDRLIPSALERPVNLTVFLTEKMSLKKWHAKGLFERETALYRRLAKEGCSVTMFSDGGPADLSFAAALDGIPVLCNHPKLPQWLYRLSAPLVFFREFGRSDILKTNQLSGAAYTVRLKHIFRKKLIVRCGFVPSLFGRMRKLIPREQRRLEKNEKKAFSAASHIIVASTSDREYVIRKYSIDPEKITVISNYVDTDLFRPLDLERLPGRIITIAKNHKQKNLGALIEALCGISGISLSVIGRAAENAVWTGQARAAGLNAQFPGVLPNEEIPYELACSEIFVLPSLYEGNPKALLEAMACGLPVIAADTAGINNIVRHGENGWLCGTDSGSIRSAVEALLGSPELRKKLGKNARRYVLEECSLEKAVQKELAVYAAVMRKR